MIIATTENIVGHRVTDQCRRARLGAIGQQRHRLYLELPRPELGQCRDVTGGSEPESEVLPYHDPGRMQRPQDRVHKLCGAPAGDLRGELDDDDLVDASVAEQLLAALQRGKQWRHLIRPDDRHRMRPEGHCDQWSARL